MSSLELLICALLVAISAFMAASEIALFSLSRFQLRSLKEHFRPSYRMIKDLLSDPGGLLITILVVNEVLNISLSALITSAISKNPHPDWLSGKLHLPPWAVDTILGLVVTAPIVLLLCEITPKVIAARINQLIAPLTVRPLRLLHRAFFPVRVGLREIVKFVSRRSRRDIGGSADETADESTGKILKEADFLLMVEEGHREGAIQESEVELIKNVFALDDTTVAEVATPLSQVQTLPLTATLRQALLAVRGQRYSRIPVTPPGNNKEVVGILYSKDLQRAKIQAPLLDVTIGTIMKKPLFVTPTLRLNALFRKFKQQTTHMAVVQAASGEVIGIVTMSDVLETLFEEIL